MGVPPEAEENDAHAQEREANCSLQHKIRKRARMLIVAGGHTVPSTKEKKKKKKKKWILIIRKKDEPFGYSYSNFDFLRKIREGWQLCHGVSGEK